jgi:hypothetical protein
MRTTKQPTVRFGMMDPVGGGNADSTTPVVADSTTSVVANPNTQEALKKALKMAQEKDWADVVSARTAASAAMLKTLKEKVPCWDDVVVSPLTTLPGENRVEYQLSYRASQGTTPLQSIGSLAIASVSATDIIKVCTWYSMVSFARATKKQCCEALIEAKANFGNAPTAGEPVVGNSTNNKKAAKTTKPSKKDVVPKFMGNYFHLINCLFHPALAVCTVQLPIQQRCTDEEEGC